ncbi:MAG: DUF4162 domain-containing protein, partial [Desulfobulbaceae bacterium]
FLLDASSEINDLQPLEGAEITQLDESTIEVTIRKGDSINRVFSHLEEHQIVIESMRNKTNRLEELFMEMVE